MKKTTKQLALETILFAMEEIKDNLQRSSSIEDVKENSEAMKNLAEAYRIVRNS